MDIFSNASDFLQNPGNGWFGPRWVLLVRSEAPRRPTEIGLKNASKKKAFFGTQLASKSVQKVVQNISKNRLLTCLQKRRILPPKKRLQMTKNNDFYVH